MKVVLFDFTEHKKLNDYDISFLRMSRWWCCAKPNQLGRTVALMENVSARSSLDVTILHVRNVYDLENSDYILGKIYVLPYFQEALKCQ